MSPEVLTALIDDLVSETDFYQRILKGRALRQAVLRILNQENP